MLDTLIPALQRRVMRRAIGVQCQVVREYDFRLLAVRGVDVSTRGMLVMGEEPALTGEPVIVSFRPPYSPHWYDAEATIARVVHGRRPGDRGLCFGLHFDRLEPRAEWFLGRALQGVPPPVPARASRRGYARDNLAALS
jgi:PilZ domain-containing protein